MEGLKTLRLHHSFKPTVSETLHIHQESLVFNFSLVMNTNEGESLAEDDVLWLMIIALFLSGSDAEQEWIV
jgi:hypothetical protein